MIRSGTTMPVLLPLVDNVFSNVAVFGPAVDIPSPSTSPGLGTRNPLCHGSPPSSTTGAHRDIALRSRGGDPALSVTPPRGRRARAAQVPHWGGGSGTPTRRSTPGVVLRGDRVRL